jgi:hypothetical protein
MPWFKNRSRATRLTILLAIVLGLATPVLAGTVYSWRTEDGTLSFTDDKKHIPARYRNEAEQRQSGSLEGYRQFTSAAKTSDGSYKERLEQRLGELQQGDARHVEGATQGGSGLSVIVGGSRYSRGGGVIVPVDGAASDEPIVTEHLRTKPADSMSTRHVTVTKQGDRIISVHENEKSHRNTPMVPPLD